MKIEVTEAMVGAALKAWYLVLTKDKHTDMRVALEAALAAMPERDGEAVAWRYRLIGTKGPYGPWSLSIDEKQTDEFIEAEALYTTPRPAPVTDGEAVAWLFRISQKDGSWSRWEFKMQSEQPTILGLDGWRKVEYRPLYAGPPSAPVNDSDRASVTSRRQSAVELLISMGYSWNESAWAAPNVYPTSVSRETPA